MKVWKDKNSIFNDAFFLMIDKHKREHLFPIWKNFTFSSHPINKQKKAIKKLNEVLTIDPNFKQALFLKAVAQRNLNYIEESVLTLHLVKENDYFYYPANIYLAEFYFYKLKFEEALSYLNEIKHLYNNNSRVIFLLAITNIELFNFDDAKKYLERLKAISNEKLIVNLLLKNIEITEEIIKKTNNKLLLKNFTLKSFNYNLQLKTNLINRYNIYAENNINYDKTSAYISAILLKNITNYPNFKTYDNYNAQNLLNYFEITENELTLKVDCIDFEKDFIHSFEEYKEVEKLIKMI